ncbi:unnamed protein product [Rotaria sordida]|nr:unnamed protein product [Rotaria sordida]
MANSLTRTFLFGSRVVQTSFVRTLTSQGSKESGTNTQSGGYGGSGLSSQQSGGRGGSGSSSQQSGDRKGSGSSPQQSGDRKGSGSS